MKVVLFRLLGVAILGVAIFGLLYLNPPEEKKARYTTSQLLPPSPFHGIHGITVREDGTLLVGSVVGRSIYEVNRETGAVSTYIGPPTGMADDLEEAPSSSPYAGALGYTAFMEGEYRLSLPDGTTRTLATGLPGLNSTAWTKAGRLFATQVFLGDALYELDPTGANPPRKIMEGMGGLNGFDIGPDGKIYGPLWFKGQIARIDPDTASLEVIAEGFSIPAAANFNSKGELFAVDTVRGEVVQVDVNTGTRTVVARAHPAIDNLAFAPDDTLYITNMADNAVIEVDPATGQTKTLVSGKLAVAGGLAVSGNTLYVADVFSARAIDLTTLGVRDIARAYASHIENPMVIAAHGNAVYVASWFSGTVQKVDPATGDILATAHGLAAPHDVEVAADGTVYVSELGTNTIWKMSEDLNQKELLSNGLQGPAMLALGPDGALYVGELGTAQIKRIDPATGTATTAAKDLQGAEGFTFGPDGRLYVAEVGAARVIAIDAAGQREVIAENLPIGFEGPAGGLPTYIPTDLAFGPDGTLYLSSDTEATIYKISRD